MHGHIGKFEHNIAKDGKLDQSVGLMITGLLI